MSEDRGGNGTHGGHRRHGTRDEHASEAAGKHVPVLLERCVFLLGDGVEAARRAGRTPVVVDATLGMGGHAEAALDRYPDIHLVGLDRDREALALAGDRLAGHTARIDLVHAVYDELPEVLDDLGLGRADAELFDLGVSSLQLDEPERGFSYARDTALDMRMNGGQDGDGLTAAEVLNTYSEAELTRILRDYGEERHARRIAAVIVADRRDRPWETSGQLAGMLQRVLPESKHGGHPAKRTFQALRIEVNRELDVLERAIPAGLGALTLGGVQVVMAYHSLEDRIVKRAHAQGTQVQAPPGLPVVPEHMQPWLEPLLPGAEKAPVEEIEQNPRAASVRLRAVRKTREKEGRR